MVFENSRETNQILDNQIENGFALGIFAQNAEISDKFIRLLHRSFPTSVSDRLFHFFSASNWEFLSSKYWISHCLRFVLLSAFQNNPIVFSASAPNSPTNAGPSSQPKHGNRYNHLDVETMKKKHSLFLIRAKSISLAKLLGLQMHLLHGSPQISHDLWISVFPLLFNSFLNKKEKKEIMEKMMFILSNEHQIKQNTRNPNILETLLRCFPALSPVASLSHTNIDAFPWIVKYVGKSFHSASYLSFHLFEAQIKSLQATNGILPVHIQSFADLLFHLNEPDHFYSLLHFLPSFANHAPFTTTDEATPAFAFLLKQFGKYSQAGEILVKLTDERSQTSAATSSAGNSFAAVEMAIFQEETIDCLRRLEKWQVIFEFAEFHGRKDLLLKSACKLNEWGVVNQIINSTPLPNSPESNKSQRNNVIECMLRIHNNGDLSTVENEINQEITSVVEKWNTLSIKPTAQHIPLFHQLQQLVEVKEGVQFLHCADHGNVEQLKAWRQRKPRKSEDFLLWNDLFQWRKTIYHKLATQNHQALTNTVALDLATSILQYSKMARLNGAPAICLANLRNINTLVPSQLSFAFKTLKQQLKCYLEGTPDMLQTGVEAISTASWLYHCELPPHCRSMIHKLKCDILVKMGQMDAANAAFGSSQLSQQSSFWLSWARFCEFLHATATATDQLLQDTFHHYLKAIQFASQEQFEKIAPLFLSLLHFKLASNEHLAAWLAQPNDLGPLSR